MFSDLETAIIAEVQAILRSTEMRELQIAHRVGQSIEVSVAGRTIIYEPSLPASGFTLSGEDSFVLGALAFVSEAELVKTLLHELYRLTTSAILKGDMVTGDEVSAETNAAFEFAERAYRRLEESNEQSDETVA